MKFNVTEIKFDFDEGDIDDPITFEEQVQITHDNLGVWEADDEDDLIEEITTASGWCIKSIDYQDSEILEEWEDLFDVHTVLENTKQEYEDKLAKAQAKQPKAEW